MTLKQYKISKVLIRLIIYVSIFSSFAQSYILSSNYEKTHAAGGIGINIINQSIKYGEYSEIDLTFTGHIGDTFWMWITDCAGTFQPKQTNIIIEKDPETIVYPWSPEEDTSCNHTVRAKTFLNGYENGKQEATISVTDSKGTAIGSRPSTTVDPADNEIDIPDEVVVSGFTYKIPKYTGSVGSLINIVFALIFSLIGFLAFISIVVSGIQYITSGGDSSKAEKAKKTLVFSILGVMLAILSIVIITAVNRL